MNLLKKITTWANSESTRKLYYRLFALVLFLDFQALVVLSMYGQAIDPNILSAVVTVLNIIILGTIGKSAIPAIANFTGKTIGKIRGDKPTPEESETPNNTTTQNAKLQNKQVANAYDVAKKYIGLKEIEGNKHNPKIIEWVDRLNFRAEYGIDSDEVAWCATFANGILLEFGLQGTGSPRAKSFLDIGTTYNIGDKLPDKPYAIIAVSHRGYLSPNKREGSGHVEIVDPESITKQGYNSIGGNVTDQVKAMNRTYDRFFIEFRVIV